MTKDQVFFGFGMLRAVKGMTVFGFDFY